MSRIEAVNPAQATGKAKELLDGVKAKLGMTPITEHDRKFFRDAPGPRPADHVGIADINEPTLSTILT